MKLFLVVLCAAAAAAAPQVYYHESIGVPEATRIKLAEENVVGSERIVGGMDATLGDYPFMGGLIVTLTSGATSVCGSTLLSHTRLLTAAHCWWDGRNQARQLTVVLGSITLFSGGVRINTNNVQIHSGWNPTIVVNNIAMVTIPFVNFTSEIMPARLPSDMQQGGHNFAGRWGIAVGFGRTSDYTNISPSQYLSRVNLQIITNAVCEQTYGTSIISSASLCTSGAGGVGFCGGDSGGPLVVVTENEHVLVGVMSFGLWSCHQSLPSAYTRVTSFEAWIHLRL